MAKFYVTTPIYYINAVPHIGHVYKNLKTSSCEGVIRNKILEVCL